MKELNEIKNDIEELYDIDTLILDATFISNNNNMQSKLINNADETFTYKLKNKKYDFHLKEPIFIEKICLKSSDNNLKNIVLEITDYFTGEKIKKPIENYKQYKHIAVNINRVISSFTIKPPFRILRINLQSITIHGYNFTELSSISTLFKESKEVKKELEEFYKSKINFIETENLNLDAKKEKTEQNLEVIGNDITEKKSIISDLTSQLIELKSSIKSDTESSESLKIIVKELKTQESSINKNLTDIKNSIEQREEESSSLNKKISNEKDILKENQNNNNLFAYELSEFLKEGSNNIKLYTIISMIPMLLIVFLTYILLKGTVDLTTIYTIKKDMDIATVFWSRLPFVLVITSIIFVCYEITKIFFIKIMEIHHQKLNFSKIGIIAKDISSTSFDGLNLDDNEKSELHTKLKMQLLREYLSSEFHIEHDYNINKSLWTRFIDWRKQKDEKKIDDEQVEINNQEIIQN
ncbi:hypothetical protein [Sulfurimonas sp.]|uniref:hypothetical protein n=1 Tax=Sulfurimonas sp. TaxID=2022749 RepID=UPI002AB2B455|nr:hypothetical protein [Sulfurimonas sp.]